MTEWSDFQFPDKTILVVEDVDTSIKFFDAALRKSKARILWAHNGQEAIDKVTEFKDDIDLVLLDLNLPIVNGFEVLKYLRKLDKDMPVIVQTAYLFSGERKTSMSMGANGFISKPIQLNDLLFNIANFLDPEMSY